jgi:preprotein translocase subunit SecF
MKNRKAILLIQILLTFIISSAGNLVFPQGEMPEILETGTIREQYDYLEERTRIYENYRAIREDMFQQIQSNSIDSLAAEKNSVRQLQGQLQDQENLVESLQEELQGTNARLDEAIRNRDSFNFLGISILKTLYNTILWAIIAGLGFIAVVVFLSNKRLISISRNSRKDLEEIKEEYEAYRRKMLRKQEELVVKHHNELRKLKGG